MAKIRYTRAKVWRGKDGRFIPRGGRRDMVKRPKPPSPESGLPRFVVLADGTRLLTTSRAGRAAIPLLEFLRDRGLLLPELIELDTAKRIAVDSPEVDWKAVPPSWAGEDEGFDEEEQEDLGAPLVREMEQLPARPARVVATKAQKAARLGWVTRRARQAQRSAAAKKGWRTRRRKKR